MNIVSTSQFTIVDLNDSVFTPNLLPWYEDWVTGSGSLERWTAHGDAAENVRSIFVDPFGYKSVLWRCIPDADGGASGGFTIGDIKLNRDKTYRFTCFIKRSSTMSGTVTIGMGNVNSLAGAALSNAPVISFMTTVEPDTWYLLVSILHPAGTTSAIGKTGIYNMRGTKLIEGTEYAFGVTAEPTFYVKLDGATTAASEVQLFMPTLECLDGTEDSIQTLIRYDGSENDYLRDVFEKGKTAIEGGLLTSNVILTAGLDGVVRSGMSGLSEDNIGFFTGGTYDDAVNNKASNIIHKDGSIRLGAGAFAYDKASNRFNLGNFILHNNDIIGIDNGIERVRFSGGDVPSIDAIDQGWGYYAAGVYGSHPDRDDILVEFSPPSRKWIYANGDGWADSIMAFSISRDVLFTGSKQYRLDDVSMDAWIYNESADESTITATWGLYNPSTDVIVYPVGGPVSVSTPISVTNTGTYKLKINVSPRIKILGVTPYQRCYFEAYFRCAGISQQGVHSRSLIGRDGIMSYYSATSYFYYKEAYGFEARFGGMGFRVSTSGIQKMVDGSTWVNDTLMNTSLASATALGIMRVGAGLSAVEGLVSISILEGTADLYRNVWFGQNTVSNSLAYDSDFVYNPALKTLQVGSTTVGRLMIGGGMLVWDNDNNALKVVSRDGATTISLYSTGSSAALGIGSGGGGTSYNRLDTWAAYIPGTTDTWVLSALLGHDLHTRVTALEEDTPNVAWGVPTTDYVPLTVNAISRQLSVHGHGHTFASLSSKPTTISGYGITDSLIYEGDARLTNSRPASDVYAWAKAATKPSYSYSDVGAAAASHTHGNITNDGKIGSTANLVIVTGTAGALTAKTAGTSAQFLRGDGSWATPPDTVYVHPTKTARNVGGTAHFITAFTSDTLGHVTGITTAAMTKADVESVLTGNSITSHYHDDRYFQKGELFTKEGSGTEADPYRIRANFPFYGISSVAALGIGSGGGGTAYDRLDTWASYDETKAGWVLSALLGVDLNSRVTALEGSTPNVAWGVPTTQYVPLTINSVSRQLSLNGHTHTKSGITDFPSSWDWSAIDNKPPTYTPSAHTHDDRYYTETEISNLFAGATAITGYNKDNWDGVVTDFGNLEIGGRNLFRNSNFADGLTSWGKNNTTVAAVTVDSKSCVFIGGATSGFYQTPLLTVFNMVYTVSFLAKSVGASSTLSVGFLNQSSGRSKTITVSGVWERYTYTTTQPVASTSNYIFHFYATESTAEGAYISDIKLEVGNKATDWTPAPEDVDASIAAVQTNLDTHAALTNNPHAVTASQVGLGNVENTKLSTWAGSGNITALGTIVSGTWSANTIAVTKGGTGKTSVAANSMLYATAANTYGELATTAFGRGLLSAVSGTEVAGLRAATATKLATARTIFGQSFDGSGNVTGNATLGTTDATYLQVGAIRLQYDATNNALKVIKSDGTAANFYATGSNTALGVGTGGGGSSYNMVSDWSQYVAGSEQWVVSAQLINAIRTSVTGHIGDGTHTSAGEKSNWNAAYSHSVVSGGVHMTSTDRNQLTTAYNHSQAAHQAIINGTGFVKSTAGVISYDDSVYAISTHTHTYASTVKLGTVVYDAASNIISLPAYPTTLPASDVSSWAKAANKPSYAFSEITSKPTSIGGYGITDAILLNDTIQNTNSFGGRRLYINSIDNALAAANKKYYVTATKHKKVYNAENYPKAINVGNILLPQWEDSPIIATYDANKIFKNNYEEFITCASDEYIKVRLDFSSDGTAYFPGFPYGTYYLSYYYTFTPDKAEVRCYNNYAPHTTGYKTGSFSNYIGDNTGSGFVQKYTDSGNYQRREIEFIIYGHPSHETYLTEIEWKLDRPFFTSHSPIFSNYGTNKSYQVMQFGTQADNNVTINPNGTVSALNFTENGVNLSSKYAAIAQTHYVGTTAITANRTSAEQSLTGITSIDGSAAKLTTPRALTIGATAKNFDGSAAVSWSLAEIGAASVAGSSTQDFATKNLTVAGTVSVTGLLTASGNIKTANVDGAYMQVGPIKILYDATNNAIRVEGNLYATGSNTAFGIGGGAGGGGLITNVYSSAGFGGSYSDVDLSSTFNAYAINSLYTALQGKQNTITGAISTLVSSNLYANYALVSGATGKVQASGVTATELSYLSGASSNIQSQLNAKPSVNSYPTAFSWNAGSTSGPTGTLSGSNMTAVSFGAIPAASATASGIVTTGSQTFVGEKSFASSVWLAATTAIILDAASSSIYSYEQAEPIITFDNDNIKVTHHWANVYEQNVIVKGYVDAAKVAPGIALARANKFATMGEKLNYQPGMIRSGQIPRKVVVIGNSMTAHAYNETLGWTVSDFREMAASKPDTGWVTLIKKHLVTLNPDVKVYKSNGAAWEAQTLGSKAYSTIQGNAVWEATETGPATTAYTLDSILDSDVDVVIVQLYENVPDTTGNAANCATLSVDYQNLYASIRAKCPNARLYQFCGFWQTEGKGTAVMTACARANVEPIHAPVLMWPRTGASQYPDNFKCVAGDIIRDADNNQLCTVSASVAGHPNDLGFGVMAAYTIFKLYNSGGVLNDYLTRFILKVNAPNGVADWMDATTDVTSDLYYDASVSTLAAFQSAYAPYLKYMVLGGKYSATVKAPTNSAGTTWAAAHCFLEIKHSGIVGNNYKPTIQRIVSGNDAARFSVERKVVLSSNAIAYGDFYIVQ